MDNQTPFKIPPFTGRNILIFSDGTGQAGGLLQTRHVATSTSYIGHAVPR
jgi:hypothetical protein